MSNLDQFFDNAGNSADNFVDATREELLEEMAPPEQPQEQPQQEAAPAAPVDPEGPVDTVRNATGVLGIMNNALQGAQGFIDDNVTARVMDVLDGDKGNLEDNQNKLKERREGEAGWDVADAAFAGAMGPAAANIPESAKRVLAGGTFGAAEATITAAEMGGDIVKSFAGLADESDQFFGDKYEWAKWDLGKDDIGAQTGAGKVAQGFVEFGLLMGATGGFGGAGAGASIGKQVLVGAAKGAAADMIDASKGEGNLSNLIRDNFPEWYPSWATALAVNEEDSPWEVIFKTMGEGALLGAVGDAAAGYLAGSRAISNAKPGTSVDQLEQIGVKAAQKKMTELAEAAVPAENQLGDVMQRAMDTGNAERFDRVGMLVDQEAKGIPVYYDDVANAFPEYFTIPAAGREVLGDFDPKVYQAITDPANANGLTINPFTGEVPTSGTAVAIDGAVLNSVDPQSVREFIVQNADILKRDDVYLGSWISKETGKPIVELSRLVDDVDEAVTLGRAFDQKSVYRFDTGEEIPTGGLDKLRETKGGHIASSKDIPAPRMKGDDATQVTAQQMQLRAFDGVSSKGSTGRTITDAQLTRIAKSTGSEDTALLLKNIADENPVDLSQLSKASQMSEDDIVREAGQAIQDTLGTGGEVDFTKLQTQKVGEDVLLTRTGIVQTRGLLQELSTRAAERAASLAKRLDNGEEAYMQFDRLVDDLKGLLKVHKVSANTYSKMLSSYKIEIPVLGTKIEIPSLRKVQSGEEMSAQINAAFKSLDEMKANIRSGDPKARSQAVTLATSLKLMGGDVPKTISVAKLARAYMADDALTAMYNSMLSSPTTHFVNGLSNAMTMVYRPISAMLGGDAKVKRQAIASFYGFFNNVSESAQIAAKVFMDPDLTSQGSKGFAQSGNVKPLLEDLSKAAELSGDLGDRAAAGFAHMLHDFANFPAFSWPSKLLTTSDEFFKAMVARMEFQAKTMGEAIDMAGATSGKPLDDVYKQVFDKTKQYNISESGQIVNPDLLATAKEVTFQTELEGWAGSFAQFVNNVPILRPFFPFVKTGHNIMVYTGTHVPLLSRHLKESQAILNGTDEYAKAMLKGRQAAGRWLVLTGAMAAYTGMITGNGPPDPQERKIWLKSNQPRSLKIGDKFIDYSRIEPFGQILSAVADLVDMSKYAAKHGLAEDSIEYLSGYLTYAIANNFTNKSYMQGVVPLGKILTPGWQGVSSLATIPLEQFNNILPLSGARRAFNNAMTPYMMEYNDQFERTWATMLPGGPQVFGSVAYDWLDGSPLDSAAGGIEGLSPIRVVQRNQSVVRDALEDMEYDSSTIMKTLQGVELKGEHKSRLSQVMGESGLEGRLKQIVTSKDWKEAKDDYYKRVREGTAGDKRNEYFYKMVNDEITDTRDRAITQIKEEFPDLLIQINDKRILRNSQKPDDQTTEVQDFNNLVNWAN